MEKKLSLNFPKCPLVFDAIESGECSNTACRNHLLYDALKVKAPCKTNKYFHSFGCALINLAPWKLTEIAALYGTSRQSIENSYSRALEKMRARLQGEI